VAAPASCLLLPVLPSPFLLASPLGSGELAPGRQHGFRRLRLLLLRFGSIRSALLLLLQFPVLFLPLGCLLSMLPIARRGPSLPPVYALRCTQRPSRYLPVYARYCMHAAGSSLPACLCSRARSRPLSGSLLPVVRSPSDPLLLCARARPFRPFKFRGRARTALTLRTNVTQSNSAGDPSTGFTIGTPPLFEGPTVRTFHCNIHNPTF
jgi:hypothetical protein